ncbi:MAG: 1-acyl-sn-glycerol-3-phosphate acyltransferase [Polyangiaceae bacterium]|nr:1-acyl-sn-glycerol-3-phosphate acyltransferase [Polyangiaceae bacterium]
MISLAILGHAAVQTVRVSAPTMVDEYLGTSSVRVHNARLLSWGRAFCKRAELRLDVAGRENITDGESYIVMSNHQSHYDIPVLFDALSIPLRMVAKKELFDIPVMSHAMRYSGFVEIDRGNQRAAVQSIKEARAKLRSGLSLWIAPEGTRSEDGQLLPFKRGGFQLARMAKARILPVSLSGTRFVLRPGSGEVHRGVSVKVTIHPPVDPRSYKSKEVDQLVEQIKTTIASGL